MSQTEQRPLFKLEQKLGCAWNNLRRAESEAADATKDLAVALEKGISKFSTEDSNLVVFGSLARREWIAGESDLDWTYLIDGQANSRHLQITQQIRSTLEKEKRMDGRAKFAEPGATGTFGNLGFSHQLVHLIGGQDDTNKNMTRRMLLLLESVPVGSRAAYDRIVRAIIDRYLEEEAHIIVEAGNRFKVPRFLLNDIVRFWRTMAVDFASKQRERGGKGWGLRNAKLRMSRKLIFASGLLVCFGCTLDQNLQEKISTASHAINLKHLANHIWASVNSTPLDILASAVQSFDIDSDVAKLMFSSYDEFIGIMSDKSSREELKAMSPSDYRSSPVFSKIRGISSNFERGLNQLFFHNTAIKLLTEKYGVF